MPLEGHHHDLRDSRSEALAASMLNEGTVEDDTIAKALSVSRDSGDPAQTRFSRVFCPSVTSSAGVSEVFLKQLGFSHELF